VYGFVTESNECIQEEISADELKNRLKLLYNVYYQDMDEIIKAIENQEGDSLQREVLLVNRSDSRVEWSNSLAKKTFSIYESGSTISDIILGPISDTQGVFEKNTHGQKNVYYPNYDVSVGADFELNILPYEFENKSVWVVVFNRSGLGVYKNK